MVHVGKDVENWNLPAIPLHLTNFKTDLKDVFPLPYSYQR